jgi:hypothetical protein
MIEEERRSGYPIPQLGRSFLEVLWPQMGSTSSFLMQTCKKPASKACWKSCKYDQKTQIISVSNNKNFLCKKSASKYDLLTYYRELKCPKNEWKYSEN